MIEDKNSNIWTVSIRDREENTITPIFITDKIDNANKDHKILTLGKQAKNLYDGIEKIKTLEPGTKAYNEQKIINETY